MFDAIVQEKESQGVTVVKSDDNKNGKYVEFSDGTQISIQGDGTEFNYFRNSDNQELHLHGALNLNSEDGKWLINSDSKDITKHKK